MNTESQEQIGAYENADQPMPQKGEVKERTIHPIASAGDKLMYKLRDIKYCSNLYIPMSVSGEEERIEELKKRAERLRDLSRHENVPLKDRGAFVKMLFDLTRDIPVERTSYPTYALRSSLFLGIFSAFDAFIGELLMALYTKKGDLLNTIDRSMEFGKILRFTSFDDLKFHIIREEIENFRRESYVKQFCNMEALFDIELRKFKNWPSFVECSQRRNLITHNDGVVNDQYIALCTKEKYQFDIEVKVGERLNVDIKYLLDSCDLVTEVGLKLCQTLWRKLFPTELEDAGNHLHSLTYNFLVVQDWKQARTFGEFAIGQKKHYEEKDKRIFIINYAIALKNLGEDQKMTKVLADADWSASSADLRLAVSALNKDYEQSSKIMKEIGKSMDVVTLGYRTWPLFNEFRQEDIFLETYEEIYKHPFIDELEEATADVKLEAKSDDPPNFSTNDTEDIQTTNSKDTSVLEDLQ